MPDPLSTHTIHKIVSSHNKHQFYVFPQKKLMLHCFSWAKASSRFPCPPAISSNGFVRFLVREKSTTLGNVADEKVEGKVGKARLSSFTDINSLFLSPAKLLYNAVFSVICKTFSHTFETWKFYSFFFPICCYMWREMLCSSFQWLQFDTLLSHSQRHFHLLHFFSECVVYECRQWRGKVEKLLFMFICN